MQKYIIFAQNMKKHLTWTKKINFGLQIFSQIFVLHILYVLFKAKLFRPGRFGDVFGFFAFPW